MKVIDLLNKIANGEEVPKKIHYQTEDFIFDNSEKVYRTEFQQYYDGDCKEYRYLTYYLDDYNFFEILNDKVEIIEEPKEVKLPDRLESFTWNKQEGISNKSTIEFFNTINQIIDYLKNKESE